MVSWKYIGLSENVGLFFLRWVSDHNKASWNSWSLDSCSTYMKTYVFLRLIILAYYSAFYTKSCQPPFLHMMEWKHFLTPVHWRVGVAIQRHLVRLVSEDLNEVPQSQVENPVSGMEQSHALLLAGDCLAESSFAKNGFMILMDWSSLELNKFTLWKRVSSPTVGCRNLARRSSDFFHSIQRFETTLGEQCPFLVIPVKWALIYWSESSEGWTGDWISCCTWLCLEQGLGPGDSQSAWVCTPVLLSWSFSCHVCKPLNRVFCAM